jgi:hypothetical protein
MQNKKNLEPPLNKLTNQDMEALFRYDQAKLQLVLDQMCIVYVLSAVTNYLFGKLFEDLQKFFLHDELQSDNGHHHHLLISDL